MSVSQQMTASHGGSLAHMWCLLTDIGMKPKLEET